MNCKPNDLAVVARVTNEDIRPFLGRIVKCIQIVHDDCWVTEPELAPGRCAYDGALMPIRGGRGTDQTLTWAGKPSEVTA